MRWPWHISDDEFVRRLERCQKSRWRRPFSAFMVLFAVAYFAAALCLYRQLYRQVVYGFCQLFDGETERVAFELGVVLGFRGGSMFYVALFCLIAGIYGFFARRKDQLLVTSYRRIHPAEVEEIAGGHRKTASEP